jgi:hypothetical protein
VKRRLFITFALLFAFLADVSRAFACATCFGQSDSALAEGMNWGILVLLGFIGCVLAGVAGFAIFLIRRNAQFAARPDANPVTSTKI